MERLIEYRKALGWSTLILNFVWIAALVISIAVDAGSIVPFFSSLVLSFISLALYIVARNNKFQTIGFFVFLTAFIWPSINLIGVSEQTSNLLVAPFITQMLVGFAFIQYSWKLSLKIWWFYGVLFLMLLSVFVFKRNFWPGAAILLIVSGLFISGISLADALQYFKQKNQNGFIIRLASGIAFLLGVLGWVFKIQHWPGANFMSLLGLPIYFVALLALIFMLPNSRFYKWTVEQKKSFIHLTLAPLVYLTFIIYLYFLAPAKIKRLALEQEVKESQLIRDDLPDMAEKPLTEKTIQVTCLENCN